MPRGVYDRNTEACRKQFKQHSKRMRYLIDSGKYQHWTKRYSRKRVHAKMVWTPSLHKQFPERLKKRIATNIAQCGNASGYIHTPLSKGRISKTLESGYRSGRIQHWTKVTDPKIVRATFKRAVPKISRSVKKLWKNPKWAIPILQKWGNRPSRLEKIVIELRVPNLKYTGAGSFWIRLDKRYKNPDFVVKPFRKTRKVVEIFGGKGWFHTEREAFALLKEYKRHGVECLLFWDSALANPQKVFKKLYSFANAHAKQDRIGETPTPIVYG